MSEESVGGHGALPELAVQPGLLDTVIYAAAMWEFQRLHFDEAWARHEGLERPVVQGPLLGNYLVRTVAAGTPAGFELAEIRWRNRAVVPVGEQLRCGGTLDPGPGDCFDAALWMVDSSGAEVVTGSARLRPVDGDPAEAG